MGHSPTHQATPHLSYPPALQRFLRNPSPGSGSLPKPPAAEVPLVNYRTLGLQTLGTTVFGVFLAQVSGTLGAFVLVTGLAGLVVQVRWQTQTYQQRQKVQERAWAAYYEALTVFSLGEAARQRPDLHHDHYRQRLEQALRPTLEVDGRSLPPPPPTALGRHLEHRFPGRIHTGLYFRRGGQYYLVELAYQDPDLHLYIAIQTQPLPLSQPPWLDFLLSQGWLVVQFPPAQTTDAPESCGEFLAQALSEITRSPVSYISSDQLSSESPRETG